LDSGICAPCDNSCATCDGPESNNCLSCATPGHKLFDSKTCGIYDTSCASCDGPDAKNWRQDQILLLFILRMSCIFLFCIENH